MLNPARDEVSEAKRIEIGAAFAKHRNDRIDGGVTLTELRKIVAAAEKEGLLDEAKEKEAIEKEVEKQMKEDS